MNDQVGCLHFFADFDSGNLESASTVDPCAADSTDVIVSPVSSPLDMSRRRLPGGSGGRLVTVKDQQYFLTVSSDCSGQGSFESSHNRSWFYFGVSLTSDCIPANDSSSSSFVADGASSHSNVSRPSIRHKATFTITNLLATNLIFDHDNRPVFCNDTMTEWERLPQPLLIQYFDRQGNQISPPPPSFLQQFHAELAKSSSSGLSLASTNGNVQDKKFLRGWSQCSQRITWSYTFTSVDETVYFAMCYPFSYHRQQQLIDEWVQKFGENRGQSHLYKSPSSSTPSSDATGVSLKRSYSQTRTNSFSDKARSRTPPPAIPVHAASAPSTPAKESVEPRKVTPRKPSVTHHVRTVSEGVDQSKVEDANAAQSSSSPPTLCSEQDPSEGVYFHRETLCFSVQNRLVDLLTISGHNGKSPDGAREDYITNTYPIRTEAPRSFVFPSKKIVLITSRVHPGETPASHVLHGLIDFLVSNRDPRSVALREKFVFKIVPMLNPDGVACGHYRTDTRGVNLNRMYDTPDQRFHPTIHAARELFLSLEATKQLVLYVDLHAHASKRGCFVFGNAWDDDTVQARALLYPKLLSLNSMHFDFPSCDFTSRSMHAGNKSDGTNKGGTGRVALASRGTVIDCFTLEASYCMGTTLNSIVPLDMDRIHTERGAPAGTAASSSRRRSTLVTTSTSNSSMFRYNPDTYHELGRGILVSLLDLWEYNPMSRLPLTPLHSLAGVQQCLERQMRMLRSEQQRMDATERHKTMLEHNKALERLGVSLNLPLLNAHNNASQHKLTRTESGAVLTVKAMKEQQESTSSTAPLRLLTA